jgi:hypothetical protein
LPKSKALILDKDDLSSLKEILIAVRVTLNELSCPLSAVQRKSLPCIDLDALDSMNDRLSKIQKQGKSEASVMKIRSIKQRLDGLRELMSLLAILNLLQQDLNDTIQFVGSEILKDTNKL